MFTSKNAIMRTVSAFTFVVVCSAVAFAACGPVACDNRPVVVPPAPQSIVLPPAPANQQGPMVSTAICTTNTCNVGSTCSTCTDARVQPTTLPGMYSRDYNYSVTSQQRNTAGIPYLIPTANGLLESPTIPLTNSVDQYYATHNVVNGRVVRTAPNPPNRAVTANFNNYFGGISNMNGFSNNPAFAPQTAYTAYNSGPLYQPGFGL